MDSKIVETDARIFLKISSTISIVPAVILGITKLRF